MNRLSFIPALCLAMAVLGCNGIFNSNRCDKLYVKFARFSEKAERTHLDSMALLEETRNILEKDQDCLDALVVLGDLYFGFDSLRLAEKCLSEAVLLDSTKIYIYYQLGLINYFTGNYKKAVKLLDKAIYLKFGDGRIVIEWSPAYTTEEERKYNVTAGELFYWAGLSCYAADDFSNSVSNFTACINGEYNEADSYLYRGLSYHYLGKKEECCNDIFRSFSKGSNKAGKYYEELCK